MYAACACLSFHATLTASQRILHSLVQSYKHMNPKHGVSLHTACLIMHLCACVWGAGTMGIQQCGPLCVTPGTGPFRL